MSRKPNPSDEAVRAAAAVFHRLPPVWKAVAIAVVLVGGLIYLIAQRAGPEAPPGDFSPSDYTAAAVPGTALDGSGRYLFCFWNVENLFDDVNDPRRPTDEEYDDPFAADAHLRQLKYDRLASALVKMNGGTGPDIIACVEVESTRAAELLQEALNAKITDPKLRYTHLAMKDLDAGRHIAPCVITRLPIDAAKTRLRGSKVRILETHLRVNGYDLCAFVTHWTSQVTQRGGGDDIETGRGKYAHTIYEAVSELTEKNPKADVLVCGDFNDTPDSEPVVQVLRATGDRAVVSANPPRLLDLMAGKPAEKFGTLWYNGKPLIYDQICVSAGMLDDKGWGCDPDSVRTATDGLIRSTASRREPWRFASPKSRMLDDARGYSDHFPVTVELRVAQPAGGPKPD